MSKGIQILSSVRMRFYSRTVETELGPIKVRTLQYAQFHIDPATKQEEQESTWEDVPEVDENDETVESLSAETQQQLGMLKDDELPSFLKHQAD